MDVSTSEQFEILGRVALAAVLGAVIGLERGGRDYAAGIRTLALVTFGACLFTEAAKVAGDDRIASQIVTGIGFIGGGLIFREGAGVKGVTTAATVWAAAAIGMAVGYELYIVAIVAAIGVFVVLQSKPVTQWLEEGLGQVDPLDSGDAGNRESSSSNSPGRRGKR